MKKFARLALFVAATLLIPGIPVTGNSSAGPGEGKKGSRSFFTHDILIDGLCGDWPSGLFYISSEAQTMYAVANDSNHIYFCLQMADESSMMTVLRKGITVWIDATGKKKESCSLHLSAIPVRPGGPPTGDPSAIGGHPGFWGNPPGKGGTTAGGKGVKRTNSNRPLTGRLVLSGFTAGYNETIPVPGPDTGFRAAMAIDSLGGLVIEGCIPLKASPSDPWTAKALAFGFGVEVSGSAGSEGDPRGEMRPGGGPGGGPGQGEGMGGGMNPAMDRGSGGGRPGGRPGGNNDNPPGGEGGQPPAKTVKTWYKFSLATSPPPP